MRTGLLLPRGKRSWILAPGPWPLNSGGFTLIEVLLALAILALIVTMIYSSFSTASTSVERAEEVRDDTDLARTLIARLTDDVANAYCGPNMVFFGKKEEVEAGDVKLRLDSLDLTTLTNWRKPDSKETDLWEVGYFFKEKPEGGGSLMFRREKRELSKDVSPLEGGVEYEITGRVESLQLRYSNGSKWQDEWGTSSSCSLPKAVEITLVLDSGKAYVTQVETRNP